MNYYTCKFIDVDEAKKQFGNLYIMEELDSMSEPIESAKEALDERMGEGNADAVGIPFKNLNGYWQLLIATEKSAYKNPKLRYVFIDKEIEKYNHNKNNTTP